MEFVPSAHKIFFLGMALKAAEGFSCEGQGVNGPPSCIFSQNSDQRKQTAREDGFGLTVQKVREPNPR